MNKISNDWYNTENWNNDKISYFKEKNVLFFETTSKYEEAFVTFPVPKGAQSFSFSFKIGNRYPKKKPGFEDSAYVTIGFGADNAAANSNGIKTPMVLGEEKFVNYSLGTEEKPVEIIGQPDFFYFKISAHNADNDEMDVYFGDFELNFYDSEGYIQFAEYVPFKKTETTEKVFIGNNMAFSLVGLYVLMAFILGASILKRKIFKKKEGGLNE